MTCGRKLRGGKRNVGIKGEATSIRRLLVGARVTVEEKDTHEDVNSNARNLPGQKSGR